MNKRKENKNRYPLSLRFLATLLALSMLLVSSGFRVLAEEAGNEIRMEKDAKAETAQGIEEKAATRQEDETQKNEMVSEDISNQSYDSEAEKVTDRETTEKTEATAEFEPAAEAEREAEAELSTEAETAENEEFPTETELEKADVSAWATQTLIRENESDRIQYSVRIQNKDAEKEATTDIKVLLPETVTFVNTGTVTVTDLQVFEASGELPEGLTVEEAGEEVCAAYADGQAVMWLKQSLSAGEEKEYFFSGTPSDAAAEKEVFQAIWLINGERLADDKICWTEDQDLRTEVQQSVELDNVIITVTYAPDVIPEDAQLVASSISEAAGTSLEVPQQYDVIMSAEAEKEAVTITDRLYFDIGFQGEDGQEVEPENGPVSVRMEFKTPETGEAIETQPELPFVILDKKGKEDKKAAQKIAESVAEEWKKEAETSWILVHLEDGTTPVNITADDATNIVTDDDNAIQEASFNLDSFSRVLAGSGQEEVDLGNTARALKTALEGSQYAGRIIQLTEDITLPDNFGYINITKEITLDLNGYTIDGNDKQNDYIVVVNSGGKLTLKSDRQNGKLTRGNKGAVKVIGSGEFILESGSITNNKGNRPAVLSEGAQSKITIAGGSVDNNQNTDGWGGDGIL